ncbi:MAG: hypothetical protein ACREBU_21945, partial [Nitrososphaera sp.]
LWVLGGEMIRDFHEDPPLRKRSVEVWLDKVIDDKGGPIIYHATSEEQHTPLIPPAGACTDCCRTTPQLSLDP